ncbi:ComEC/Rec2 family competence protein [Novosphingobium profundi]|uniref:ComEC/Rec2 family competence protein n=1 Tax=Novosphingobium profundi TaxID=1774954 RepID=UPI0031BA832F
MIPGEFMSPDPASGAAALRRRQWNSERNLSSALAAIEGFLSQSGHDHLPWLCVAFGAGIVAWFALPLPAFWIALISLCLAASLAAHVLWRRFGVYAYLSQAFFWIPLLLAAGCALIWARSELVGTAPIERPILASLSGRVLSVETQSALGRRRLIVATREPGTGRAIRIRVNLPDPVGLQDAVPKLAPGMLVRFSARLMPPAPPMLPGGYNFARTAWFSGLAASGTVTGRIDVLDDTRRAGRVAELRQRISAHVLERVNGPGAGIAAALASGERGAIDARDDQAMRDSGLAHLLAISGLHVSAVIGLLYVLTLRGLALWPALALRVRLPIVAGGCGALGGIGYTLMTGAQVPTVRSCIAALLVLLALALGRAPLSVRMLTVAAFGVLALWPETITGPSFQMSFAAVLALVALSSSAWMHRFLASRDEGVILRVLRWLALLMLSGLVIELALMPIALFHFHRAGIYGSLANLVAIPMTTFVIMPGLVFALAADLVGLGAPLWWTVGRAIEIILAIAHWVSARPGAVTVLPSQGGAVFALFVAGGLWLGLWTGRIRMLGLIPAALGTFSLAQLEPPDLLIAGDGRNVGIVTQVDGEPSLALLRPSRSDYVRENFLELAGLRGEAGDLGEHADARCSLDFCTFALERDGQTWTILLSRTRDPVSERELAAACDRADIVIADRWLPRSCRPRWLKADRRLLSGTGGLSVYLAAGRVTSVAQGEGEHGWWRSARPPSELTEVAAPALSDMAGRLPAEVQW